MQSYAVQVQAPAEPDSPSTPQQTGQAYWHIQNVRIQQVLRFGSRTFNAEAAQIWFNQAVSNYQKDIEAQQQVSIPAQGFNRVTAKQYQQISKASPRLNNLYID